jgi:hypothetical protein
LICSSNLFENFSGRVFGLQREQVRSTPAFRHLHGLGPKEADEQLLARILAFAPSTWAQHACAFQEFQKFCSDRNIGPLECVPQLLNVFLLGLAQKNISILSMESKIDSISFCLRFFMVPDITKDVFVDPVKKFIAKVCPKTTNLKKPFGSVEVRKIWNYIDNKYKDIFSIPIFELRTFVLAVTQYHSFCRFSDLAVVKLSDVTFDIDYFKIVIQVSKTDQQGHGQSAFVFKICGCVARPSHADVLIP